MERAWFEKAPLRLHYRGADGHITERHVRLEQIVLERSVTLPNCVDLDKRAVRQFRLDRVVSAQIEPAPTKK